MALGKKLFRNGVAPEQESQTPIQNEAGQEPTWDEVVARLGSAIKALRESQSLTLQQIHAQTKVPMYHLQALEAGRVEQMPEEIFVRGFLQRICRSLGDEGLALLAELPEPQPMPLQLGKPESIPSGYSLNASHLYLGYATLLAGSIGGLAWLEHSQAHYTTTPIDSTQEVQEAVHPKLSPQAQQGSTSLSRQMSQQHLTSVQLEQVAPEFSSGNEA